MADKALFASVHLCHHSRVRNLKGGVSGTLWEDGPVVLGWLEKDRTTVAWCACSEYPQGCNNHMMAVTLLDK